ncbi:hypothetical protein THTE_3151 [Thermogutta terrifontis]|uniref:Uncharacterized protein n=1 Tax=Thermogutta terrifontis TaxID=1331910 RepID=A0A286RIG8_9BACT|nr:hypothetical protein THTE_3151 [Thermogutta terrifontis]
MPQQLDQSGRSKKTTGQFLRLIHGRIQISVFEEADSTAAALDQNQCRTAGDESVNSSSHCDQSCGLQNRCFQKSTSAGSLTPQPC